VRYLDESYTADPHERTPKVFNLTRQCVPGAECLARRTAVTQRQGAGPTAKITTGPEKREPLY
jgi:hypothetical protein